MDISNNLIKLRKSTGRTQEEVAEKLGITRQTYRKIENDEVQLSTAQLELLSSYFGVPIEEFFYGVQNVEKFKQIYLYVLTFFGEKGVPKTKLAKLLYLIDFNHYYNHFESMSGALYKCKEYGPLADPFLEMTDNLFENGEISIDCLSMGAQMVCLPEHQINIDFNLLSEEDKMEITKICESWKNANTQTIVNFTHHQKPWMSCRPNEVIPYELILQEDPDHVY